MLDNPEVDAIYCAVPHHLHQEFYIAIIHAGKHLLAEKPFGIDQVANDTIMAAVRERPDVVVRCSSEFPFFPGVQRIFRMIETSAFGNIFEVNGGFLHSSDLDASKPINWKRIIALNGEYGVMQPGQIGHWLKCPNPAFDGSTPLQVVERGELDRIWHMLFDLESGQPG